MASNQFRAISPVTTRLVITALVAGFHDDPDKVEELALQSAHLDPIRRKKWEARRGTRSFLRYQIEKVIRVVRAQKAFSRR